MSLRVSLFAQKLSVWYNRSNTRGKASWGNPPALDYDSETAPRSVRHGWFGHSLSTILHRRVLLGVLSNYRLVGFSLPVGGWQL